MHLVLLWISSFEQKYIQRLLCKANVTEEELKLNKKTSKEN